MKSTSSQFDQADDPCFVAKHYPEIALSAAKPEDGPPAE
jgi:hypothetical protein